MSGADEMPDDATLERIAAGDGSVSEDVTYAQALAMEVLRLRARVDAAHLAFVRIIQAASVCGEVDLAAVDATPESAIGMVRELRAELIFSRGERGAVEDLARRMEARALRAETRAEKAEGERDALRAAARKYLATLAGEG